MSEPVPNPEEWERAREWLLEHGNNDPNAPGTVEPGDAEDELRACAHGMALARMGEVNIPEAKALSYQGGRVYWDGEDGEAVCWMTWENLAKIVDKAKGQGLL